MIFKHKINLLSEDELNILMYVLKENSKDNFEWHQEYLTALKPEILFEILNVWAGKIKPEHKHIMQSISDKLIG